MHIYIYISFVHSGRELVIRFNDGVNTFAMLRLRIDTYDGFIREHVVMVELQRFVKNDVHKHKYFTCEVYMCVLIVYESNNHIQ